MADSALEKIREIVAQADSRRSRSRREALTAIEEVLQAHPAASTAEKEAGEEARPPRPRTRVAKATADSED